MIWSQVVIDFGESNCNLGMRFWNFGPYCGENRKLFICLQPVLNVHNLSLAGYCEQDRLSL